MLLRDFSWSADFDVIGWKGLTRVFQFCVYHLCWFLKLNYFADFISKSYFLQILTSLMSLLYLIFLQLILSLIYLCYALTFTILLACWDNIVLSVLAYFSPFPSFDIVSDFKVSLNWYVVMVGTTDDFDVYKLSVKIFSFVLISAHFSGFSFFLMSPLSLIWYY